MLKKMDIHVYLRDCLLQSILVTSTGTYINMHIVKMETA